MARRSCADQRRSGLPSVPCFSPVLLVATAKTIKQRGGLIPVPPKWPLSPEGLPDQIADCWLTIADA